MTPFVVRRVQVSDRNLGEKMSGRACKIYAGSVGFSMAKRYGRDDGCRVAPKHRSAKKHGRKQRAREAMRSSSLTKSSSTLSQVDASSKNLSVHAVPLNIIDNIIIDQHELHNQSIAP